MKKMRLLILFAVLAMACQTPTAANAKTEMIGDWIFIPPDNARSPDAICFLSRAYRDGTELTLMLRGGSFDLSLENEKWIGLSKASPTTVPVELHFDPTDQEQLMTFNTHSDYGVGIGLYKPGARKFLTVDEWLAFVTQSINASSFNLIMAGRPIGNYSLSSSSEALLAFIKCSQNVLGKNPDDPFSK